MNLSIGSAAGLEASWRDMGEKSAPPPLGAASSLGEGEEYLHRRGVSAAGKPIRALQVMAKLMDSSNGRDKFLVGFCFSAAATDPPPPSPPP